MTPEIKQRWIKALRSGAYKQGREFLEDKTGKCCCLGVLANVCGVPNDSSLGGTALFIFRDHERYDRLLPSGFQGLDERDINQLTGMNDDGASFAAIADYIETNISAEASHE